MILSTIILIIEVAVVLGVLLLHVAYAVYFERKILGHIQARLGPTEVGPLGLFQPFADLVKLFFKEDNIPFGADKFLFTAAPVIVVTCVMTSFSVIPFAAGWVLANINVGLLFILAMSSLGVYGIIIAGWSSNSKYAFLGALRSSAQIISYEIPMGIALLAVLIMTGSLNLSDIVYAQDKLPWGMFIFPQIIGFFVFLVCALAETNRTPFDLPEAETELVAGYLTEYSGFRWGLFFLAEYSAMYVMSSMLTICFLGGWTLPPFLTNLLPILNLVPGIIWFLLKVYAIMFFYIWVRGTVPRYRFDQLLKIGWKLLLPLSLTNLFIIMIIKKVFMP
jgi:NADH-quinone oxidoreductase subunit H